MKKKQVFLLALMMLALFMLCGCGAIQEKSVELLKKNNAGGIFSGDIGAFLSIYGDAPEEAGPFLSEALLSGISTLLTVVVGYVFLFRARKDWASAMDILSWGIVILNGLRTETKMGILEKTLAEMLVLLAYVQTKTGMQAEASESLNKARAGAVRFDSMPDYSLRAMRFADHMEHTAVFDIFGATALLAFCALGFTVTAVSMLFNRYIKEL